jgi:serine/threonine-protein kinase
MVEVELEVPLGSRVGNRFRLERVLGRGGSSVVVAARDEKTGAPVAVKLLRAPDPTSTERLFREAKILAGLTNPHLTRLIDFGTESGRPFLVTELVDGSDLSAVLRDRGALPVEEACAIMVQACLGLEAAHARGIVHRDIKPGNVLVTRASDGGRGGGPLVKLVDFGVSRMPKATGEGPTLTESDHLLGTPHYMAPEQIKNARSADARADVYSLGALFYRLLTNAYPFEGETAGEVIINIASTPAPSVRAVRPEVPAAVDSVIRKCLAKSVGARIQTAAELRELIAASLEGPVSTRSEPALPLAHELSPVSRASPSGAVQGAPTESVPRRRRSVVFAPLLALVLGIPAALAAARIGWPSARPTTRPSLQAAEDRPSSSPSGPPPAISAASSAVDRPLGTPPVASSADARSSDRRHPGAGVGTLRARARDSAPSGVSAPAPSGGHASPSTTPSPSRRAADPYSVYD